MEHARSSVRFVVARALFGAVIAAISACGSADGAEDAAAQTSTAAVESASAARETSAPPEVAAAPSAIATSAASASPSAIAADANAPPPIVRRDPTVRVWKVEAPKNDPEKISAEMQKHEKELLGCYDAARATDRTLMGRVTIALTSAGAGKPEKQKTSGDLPEAMRKCVLAIVAASAVPHPKEDSPVTITLEFEPGRVNLRVNGKAFYDATSEDVKTALKAAGCTEMFDDSERLTVHKYRATLNGKHVAVTFTPKTTTANPGSIHLASWEIDLLRTQAAVFQATDFILAIIVDGDADRHLGKALIERVVTEE